MTLPKFKTKYVKKHPIESLLPNQNAIFEINSLNEIMEISLKELFNALKYEGKVKNLDNDYWFIKDYLRRSGYKNPDSESIESIINGILDKKSAPNPSDYRICRFFLYKIISERGDKS